MDGGAYMNDQQTVELTVAYDASGDSRTLKQSVGGASAEDLGGALSATRTLPSSIAPSLTILANSR